MYQQRCKNVFVTIFIDTCIERGPEFNVVRVVTFHVFAFGVSFNFCFFQFLSVHFGFLRTDHARHSPEGPPLVFTVQTWGFTIDEDGHGLLAVLIHFNIYLEGPDGHRVGAGQRNKNERERTQHKRLSE